MVNFGIDVSDGSIVDPGINAKLSELHAARGLAMLDDLDAIPQRGAAPSATCTSRELDGAVYQTPGLAGRGHA